MVTQRGIEADPTQVSAILNMKSPTSVKEVQSLTGRLAALNRFLSRSTDRCKPLFQAIKKAGGTFEWTQSCEEAFQDLKKYLSSPPLLSKPKKDETLYVYLAVSNGAVSAALIREDEGVQKPVYYVSKALLDAETRYQKLEKLALALIVTSRKLKHYFQSFPITVLTEYPLGTILKGTQATGRLSK